tara:strand:+ start:4216 stop:4386 length:171 start_codon:yes stop_codon:yes gene_type:complete
MWVLTTFAKNGGVLEVYGPFALLEEVRDWAEANPVTDLTDVPYSFFPLQRIDDEKG